MKDASSLTFENLNAPGVYVLAKGEDGSITKYELFPGITLYVMDIFKASLGRDIRPEGISPDVITVNHCQEGRFEGEFSDNEFVYLGEGDVGVAVHTGTLLKRNFPLSRFKGSLLVADEVKAGKSLSELSSVLGDVPVDFEKIKNNIAPDEKLVIFRKSSLSSIFEDIYKENREPSLFYLRLKVLEILGRLSEERESLSSCRFFERQRVEAVKEMRNFLVENISEKYTQEELSYKYNIPLTSLKECFKAVFGMPVNTYMREYRIKVAMKLLKETSLSVADVSERVGYANQSKFAEVFKERTTMSPMEYRNKSYR